MIVYMHFGISFFLFGCVNAALDNAIIQDIIRPIAIAAQQGGDSVTQGAIGACHTFACQRLFEDATGVKVSTAGMFSQHMKADTDINSLLEKEVEFVNSQRKKIEQITREQAKAKGANQLDLEPSPWLSRVIAGITSDTPDHEGGILQADLELLRKHGGEIVKDNSDWNEKMVPAMQSLAKERKLQITSKTPLDPAVAKSRLEMNGVTPLAKIAAKPSSANAEHSELIKNLAKNLKIKSIIQIPALFPEFITKSRINARKLKIIEALKTSAVDASVNFKMYSKVAYYKGPAITWKRLQTFTETGSHAVVIAGYKASTDSFLVMDSNRAGLLEIRANDMVLSTVYANVLVPK